MNLQMDKSEKNNVADNAGVVRMNRTAFRIISREDKGYNRTYWLQKTVYERLCAAWYLTCCAYNIPYSADHTLDRTAFRIKKHGD